MAVTSYDGSFSFKQDTLARLGRRDESKMSADQYKAFQNSPFMQKVKMTEDLCWQFTSTRDDQRMKTDPAFKPQDTDFTAAKAFEYDKAVNYYKVLGLEEFATQEEVKKAYKKLSLVYHPDKTAGLSQEQKDEYADIFIELKNAYLTLSDNPTRRQYDRDRDKDKAAFEINGFKIKQKAHFDATEVMKKLQEMQRPPGRTVDVPITAKLEKFFYGGHKAIKRQRMTKNGQDMRLYRVDIPRGAAEPHECLFRRQGDYHADTQPDNINFKIKSKPHDVVERLGQNLQLRRQVELGREVFSEPFLAAQTPSVRGRHLLLWGRNPFYRAVGAGTASLRVTVQGEGLPPTGSLRFDCRVSGTAGGIGTSSSAGSTQPARSGQGSDGTVPVTVKHMQTGGKLCLRLKRDATMAEIRNKITAVLGLARGSSVRLLYQYSGGYTPYPDRQQLGDMTELLCAGTAWTGVVLTAEKAKKLLQEVIAVSETEAFRSSLAAIRGTAEPEAELWGALAHILPEYGCEPAAEALEEKIADCLALVETLPDAAYLREKIQALKEAARTAHPGAAAASGAAPRGVAHASLKRFLLRHDLGPMEGIEAPGSDSESEQQQGEGGEFRHGEGGLCSAPAMLRRTSRRLKRELACEAVLAPVGDPITLFTKPTCQITFYSNIQQPKSTDPGLLEAPRMFMVSISSPPCAKRIATREWEVLKASLVPALQLTSFHLLQAARQLLPRAISDFAQGQPGGDEAGELEVADDGLFGEERLRLRAEAQSPDTEPQREQLAAHCRERRESQRRQLALERRAAAHQGIPMPWKRLGDEAFRSGDFFTAARRYSQCLELMGSPLPEEEDRKQQAAVALSNRAACLAKVGHYEASLADARAALELRPRWGRAWGRVGTVAQALRRGEEAVEAFFKAAEYEPSPGNAQALQNAATGARGHDPDVAHAEKERGNTAMRANDVGLAVAHYTLGIAALPPEEPQKEDGPEDPHAMLRSVLHSNRSAAFCRVKSWTAAVADAEKAVAAKEDFGKAYSRLGTALLGCRLIEKAYAAFAKAIKMESNSQAARKGRQACIAVLPTWSSLPAQRRMRERFGADLKRPKGSTKVYCISDVHFDHKVNEEWTHRIDDFKFQEDVLIVAGNASDSKNGLVRGLTTLKSKFRRVFYVPGNHELWMHNSEMGRYPDSLAKLLGIFEACDELGVDVFPAAVAQDVFIVPMLSWYTAEFDVVDPFPDPTGNPDKNCRWPLDADSQVWKYMLKLNEAHLRHPYHGTVITFTHFLPLQGLPFNSDQKAAKTMGCEEIDDQLRTIKVKSRAHVYGHSYRKHAGYDNGILYVNHYHGQDGGQEDRAPIFLLYDGKGLVKKEVEIYDGPSRE